MKVFLTGATGGIGTFTCEALLAKGFKVAALVRPESLSKLNKDVHPIVGDLAKIAEVSTQFSDFNPDVVIHLGWIGVDQREKSNPQQIENLRTAVELLRMAKSNGVKTFIGMGSESEYGVQNKKLSETDSTLPLTNYATAKLATGLLCEKICKDSNIKFVWLRLFSSYGPGDRSGSLMSILIRTLLKGEPMPLSACEQVWDYTHVKDIARLITLIAYDPKEGGYFNLGGGQARKLKDVVLKIADLINPNAELQFGKIPYGPSQMMHLEADISKLYRVYGWKPEVALEDGLKETIQFHKQPM